MRIGIIGLGKIAQMKYIPSLLMEKQCELVAVCDSCKSLVHGIAKQQRINDDVCCYDMEGLIKRKPELVFVLTHEHYEISKQLIDAGINVCIEKPLCWEVDQINELIKLSERKNVKLFAAYMKQFDANFQTFKELLANNNGLLQINVKCYAGNNKLWADRQYDIKKAVNDEKKDVKDQLDKKWESLFEKNQIEEERKKNGNKLLLQLGIHQINLLNQLCGKLEVSDAKINDSEKNQVVNVLFKTQNNCPIHYTLIPCFSGAWLWEEQYEAVFSDKIITYSVGSPFLRTNESYLEITDAENGTIRKNRLRCDIVEPFERMIEAVINGNSDSTNSKQACDDLEVINSIMRKATWSDYE